MDTNEQLRLILALPPVNGIYIVANPFAQCYEAHNLAGETIGQLGYEAIYGRSEWQQKEALDKWLRDVGYIDSPIRRRVEAEEVKDQ